MTRQLRWCVDRTMVELPRRRTKQPLWCWWATLFQQPTPMKSKSWIACIHTTHRTDTHGQGQRGQHAWSSWSAQSLLEPGGRFRRRLEGRGLAAAGCAAAAAAAAAAASSSAAAGCAAAGCAAAAAARQRTPAAQKSAATREPRQPGLVSPERPRRRRPHAAASTRA